MRRCTASSLVVLLVLATHAGCVVRGRGQIAAYALDVAATSAGIMIATHADIADGDPYGDSYVNDEPIERAIAGTGVVLAAAGVVGLAVNYYVNRGSGEAAVAAPAPLATVTPPMVEAAIETAPTWADATAVRMTRQARHAAARGACPAVATLAPRVEHADARYFHTVFAIEPSLAGCLAAAGWRHD